MNVLKSVFRAQGPAGLGCLYDGERNDCEQNRADDGACLKRQTSCVLPLCAGAC